MAKKCWVIKHKRRPKYSSRKVRRCSISGRRRAYMRRFGLSRIQLREMASDGLIPGMIKASW